MLLSLNINEENTFIIFFLEQNQFSVKKKKKMHSSGQFLAVELIFGPMFDNNEQKYARQLFSDKVLSKKTKCFSFLIKHIAKKTSSSVMLKKIRTVKCWFKHYQ